MDWAKTKNIFIMLFFLLNVFLSIILIYTLNGNNITKDTIDDARQALPTVLFIFYHPFSP